MSIVRCDIRKFILCMACFGLANIAIGQAGLIVNEASNGISGSKEFIELVVISTASPCSTENIGGWIIDDNNGDFSCGPASGTSISTGHARLSPTAAQWQNVPVGAIIVIYNDADPNTAMPANDPTDANGDSVYIVPISDPSIEVTATSGATPTGSGSCPGTGNAGYAGNTYGNFTGGASRIALSNTRDAIQVRMPNGTYFHGISYGSAVLTGGPDNLKISTSSGSGGTYVFNGGDFRLASSFSRQTASTNQTPGAPNNAGNAAFISAQRSACQTPSSSVPTLSEWGLIVLGLMVACFGAVAIRTKKIALTA